MTNHEQIVAAYEQYIAENEKFTVKGVKAAAARLLVGATKIRSAKIPQRP